MTQDVPQRDKPKYRFGPGLLVTAAFVGPGTVVTASKAGAGFGCELLWAILFASIGAIVLQSLAARLGITRGRGLGESIRGALADSRWLIPAIVLVTGAIGIGNAAYQTGNLTGAAVGIESVCGGTPALWISTITIVTAAILLLGNDRILQATLIALVIVLSLSFLSTAAMSLPGLEVVTRGLLSPKLTQESLTLVIALIGTTIVPYNLFLHASGSAKCWQDVEPRRAIAQARWDTCLSISLGGLVTASILLTANSAFFVTGTAFEGTSDISQQLYPALGRFAGVVFAFGLFAAGLTSSITAPLAAAYAVCGMLGWPSDPSHGRFRMIALAVLLVGAFVSAALGKSPMQTIVFAQVANGILLPVIAVFLIFAVTRQQDQRIPRLGSPSIVIAWLVVVGVCALGFWRVCSALLPWFVAR